MLTVVQMGAARYQEARDTCRWWVQDHPDAWLGHYYLGQALTFSQDYEEALAPLEKAMALAPNEKNQISVGRSLGFALEKLKRYEEAIAAYEKAGDELGTTRVRENIETLEAFSDIGEIGDGTVCIEFRDLEEESELLEKELRALGVPPGR